jgi:hypothetical protein
MKRDTQHNDTQNNDTVDMLGAFLRSVIYAVSQNKTIMLISVVMLNVIMLSVVVPVEPIKNFFV